MPRRLYSQGKNPWYPLNRKLYGASVPVWTRWGRTLQYAVLVLPSPQKFPQPPYYYYLWQEIKTYQGRVGSSGMMFINIRHLIRKLRCRHKRSVMVIPSTYLSQYKKSYLVPCHHGVARPRVADGGDGLQTWRVATNIWNKQSRTTYKGWPSSLAIRRRGYTMPHRKKQSGCCEHCNEPSGSMKGGVILNY
jgi:hypothetical protein